MKKMLFTLAFALTITLGTTNAQQTTSTENIKIVTHVAGNHYNVIFQNESGATLQEGQYYRVGENFKPHGIWKLYDLNTQELVTTAKYDKGEQVWVETNIDGQIVHVDKMELTVKKLEDRIVALEKKIEKLQD